MSWWYVCVVWLVGDDVMFIEDDGDYFIVIDFVSVVW